MLAGSFSWSVLQRQGRPLANLAACNCCTVKKLISRISELFKDVENSDSCLFKFKTWGLDFPLHSHKNKSLGYLGAKNIKTLTTFLKNPIVGCGPPSQMRKGSLLLSILGIALRAQQEEDSSLPKSSLGSLNSLATQVMSS